MDIKLPESALRQFLKTTANADKIAEKVSLCGPTFDRTHHTDTDTVFDIEIITNRIDSASAQGVARESVAILNQFDIPAKLENDPYQEKISLITVPKLDGLDIKIEDQSVTPRFVATIIRDVVFKDSPLAVQNLLQNAGERSLNNLVDITNELTLLYGMPSHIFDLDKIVGKTISHRQSRSNESLNTLDGQNTKLEAGDIVIEDGEGLIDLCGIMGGEKAIVDQNTKNILFIVPVYDPKKIRQTSLRVQKRTLAAQIYEKRPDPEICLAVMQKGIALFTERAKGVSNFEIFDFYPQPKKPKTIDLNLQWLNQFIGLDLTEEKVITILSDLGFGGEKSQDILKVNIPSWRHHDINIREDLAEEVARVYGYFRLPAEIPAIHLLDKTPSSLLQNELRAKNFLAMTGAHEVVNNSLISMQDINDSGLDLSKHLRLQNALIDDYEYLRLSLLPNLLRNLYHNQAKQESASLFELANTYEPKEGQELPSEVSHLSFVSTKNYLEAKGILEALLDHLNFDDYEFILSDTDEIFQKNQSADLIIKNQRIGTIGLVKPTIVNNFGLSLNPTVFELNFELLNSLIDPKYHYQPISGYPDSIEDLTLTSALPLGKIIKTIHSISPLVKQVTYRSSYQGKHTFTLTFGSQEKTLTKEEITSIKDQIFKELA